MDRSLGQDSGDLEIVCLVLLLMSLPLSPFVCFDWKLFSAGLCLAGFVHNGALISGEGERPACFHSLHAHTELIHGKNNCLTHTSRLQLAANLL